MNKKIVKFNCNWCKIDCVQPMAQFKNHANHFCSMSCRSKFHSKKISSKNNPNWIGGKIKIKCKYKWCNNVFERFKNGVQQFCSTKCHGKWLSKYNIGKNHPGFKEKIKIRCANCSNTLYLNESRIKRSKNFFCSYRCEGEWLSKNRSGKNSPSYINGFSNKPYNLHFLNIRDEIRKRDGCKCKKCGLTQKYHLKKYNQKLHVHHVDYNKFNYNPRLLISLCIFCNTKVNKNRDYWFAYFSYILEKFYGK